MKRYLIYLAMLILSILLLVFAIYWLYKPQPIDKHGEFFQELDRSWVSIDSLMRLTNSRLDSINRSIDSVLARNNIIKF